MATSRPLVKDVLDLPVHHTMPVRLTPLTPRLLPLLLLRLLRLLLLAPIAASRRWLGAVAAARRSTTWPRPAAAAAFCRKALSSFVSF
jgi:hypothetical protein